MKLQMFLKKKLLFLLENASKLTHELSYNNLCVKFDVFSMKNVSQKQGVKKRKCYIFKKNINLIGL